MHYVLSGCFQSIEMKKWIVNADYPDSLLVLIEYSLNLLSISNFRTRF